MEFPGTNKINEPLLRFDAHRTNAHNIHPLKGLQEYGPYSLNLCPLPEIRVGVICPLNSFHIIQGLFMELNRNQTPIERKEYLPQFNGFENIFKSKIHLLPESNSIQIDSKKIIDSQNKPYINLSQELSNAIRSMAQRKQDFDVLYIYLPQQWQSGFVDATDNFDLHDFLKAKTAMLSIPTQIIREDAITYRCRCSVMWRLSIALYVKAGGVPWKLNSMDGETAFIGLSYSTRFNTQTNHFDFTTCCSQVFDADGTGLEFLAYDTGEIERHVGENPFLSRNEMRKVMSKSLNLYLRRHSGRLPKRLIVHKTTNFTNSEINGAFDVIPQNIKLELLQIIEHSKWKGIKYNQSGGGELLDNFPVDRGSYVQINPHEILLWTQGNVRLNPSTNFYKEMKNIPSPITIKRFAGDGGWDQNCQAIMGLTKMNWNHDALYDRLPVTLGYAKVLATTIKRMHELINKPYEFRYFM
jgi:hypothetical protein